MTLEQRVADLERRVVEAEELASEAFWGLHNALHALGGIAERLRQALNLPENELVEIVEATISQAAAAGMPSGVANWPNVIVDVMESARALGPLDMKASADLRASITLLQKKSGGEGDPDLG